MYNKILTFTLLSIGLIVISRSSLLKPGSHGFYRFFAWEFIIGLIVLNIEYWFVDPFLWYQIIAWLLLIISIIPVIWGSILLRSEGNPIQDREGDDTLIAFEKTTNIVKVGIYKYIRHPLYSSLLLLAWGTYFKKPSLPGFGLAVLAFVFLILTARADEDECIGYFGEEYKVYMTQTKRFIPFIF